MGVLIVSGSSKGCTMLSELLGNTYAVTAVQSGGEARRILLERAFDTVIINAPLPDEFGHALATETAANTAAGILLIVKSELADEVSDRVEEYGVFVLPKPISRPLFYQALKLIDASRKRLHGLQRENQTLQEKLEEIKLVDRAKCVLIQYLHMSEQDAHRYIEKQAMDTRTTRKSVAESILRAYAY